MTTLVPMSDAGYAAFLAIAVPDYATSSVAAGRWAEADALALAQAEFDRLLPQGRATPDHHLLEIHVGTEGPPVGFLWFAVTARGVQTAAFVFQVYVEPAHRRQGHARAAFAWLEAQAPVLGFANIGLHVFDGNDAALRLYRGLGFRVTGTNLLKALPADGTA